MVMMGKREGNRRGQPKQMDEVNSSSNGCIITSPEESSWGHIILSKSIYVIAKSLH